MKKCGEPKELVCFGINRRNKTDGRQPKCKECNKKYYEANKDKIKGRISKHYKNNRGEILKRRDELRQRPEAKRKKSSQDRKYNENNKEKIAAIHSAWAKNNRDKTRANQRNWYHRDIKSSRLKSKIGTHKRRAAKEANGNNTLTEKECRELFSRQDYCEYCRVAHIKLCIEHIVPLSRGGQN